MYAGIHTVSAAALAAATLALETRSRCEEIDVKLQIALHNGMDLSSLDSLLSPVGLFDVRSRDTPGNR